MRQVIKEEWKQDLLAKGENLHPELFPQMFTLSAVFFYQFIYTAKKQMPPEFIYLPEQYSKKWTAELMVRVFEWNQFWEAGHLRHEIMEKTMREYFKGWETLSNRFKGQNTYLLSGDMEHRYEVFAPIYHLLPLRTLKKFGLPCFKAGHWPFKAFYRDIHMKMLPKHFETVLSQAFAQHIWPLIDTGSPLRAYSRSNSIRLLSHNLNFWLPYAYQVAENRLRQSERHDCDNKKQLTKLEKARQKVPPEAELNRPLFGGDIWCGEADSWDATKEMVNLADKQGRLRDIIDTMRSHRIKDDFSAEWSHAKEDFERKIYRKRSKIRVTFVELEDTIPVHNTESEVHENILWQDFLGLLNEKEKHIVVCLRNGKTKLAEVAKELGYANHSPVSKALNRIRQTAMKMLFS